MRVRDGHSKGKGMSFGELGLSAVALEAVEKLGYSSPTPVQEATIPAVLSGRDVMAAAQTGTGKTAAFLLPVMDRLGAQSHTRAPRVLVVTPTRELALQIAGVAEVVGSSSGHRSLAIVGGVGMESQRRELERGCDIVVATPGRLIDLLEQGCVELGEVEVLVLDEADRMLDMGFLPSVRRIVERVPKRRQTLLFSATLGYKALKPILELTHDPVRVEVDPQGSVAESIEQYVLAVVPEAKKRVLVEVLRREGPQRVLVFVRRKHRADHLSRILQKKGFSSGAVHGDRTQGQRSRALAQFASGKTEVLVATDVLARGIDIPEVAYVVNLDVPHEAEVYVHRIGRTGRAGGCGWALTLCSKEEYADLCRIERLTGTTIALYPRADGIDCGDPEPYLGSKRCSRGCRKER